MMKWILPLLYLFAAAATAFGQVPTPPDDVVRISTDLIQLDVTVTDKKGNAIRDLRHSEFEIYENGKRREVSAISFIAGGSRIGSPLTKTPAPSSANIRPGSIRRTIALVVDDLSLSFRSAYDTRRALKKFVDEQMQDGDLVAILRTGAGIGALQQFTSDKRLLYAAIERVKWNPNGSGRITAFASIGSTAQGSSLDEEEGETDDPTVETGSGESIDSFRQAAFATGTLGALRFVVNGMADLPGRKSIILFSDGFRIQGADGVDSPIYSFLRRLIDTAARSSIVFYAIDARGLPSTAIAGDDNEGGMTPSAQANVSSSRTDELFATREGLVYLARETGGFAAINNNDLDRGVQRILEDQSYYLVAYEPDEDSFDPTKRQFNKIEIKVTRPGLVVRTRSGFFNAETLEPNSSIATANAETSLMRAITSPFGKNGLTLRMNAVFANDAKTGSFVRSLLHIDGGSVRFDQVDGRYQAKLEILAMVFGDNGDLVDTLLRNYTVTLKPDAYLKAAKDGFVYNFVFPVKNAGAYQYRIAIRDAGSDRIGSANQFIEVPNIRRNVFAISGLVVRSYTAEEWRSNEKPTAFSDANFVFNDTAIRRIRRNTVLNYGAEIYNARPRRSPADLLTMKICVFRDGELVLDGKETLIDRTTVSDQNRIAVSGAFAVGTTMPLGDHVLQMIVTEKQSGKKPRTISQVIDLEIVE